MKSAKFVFFSGARHAGTSAAGEKPRLGQIRATVAGHGCGFVSLAELWGSSVVGQGMEEGFLSAQV